MRNYRSLIGNNGRIRRKIYGIKVIKPQIALAVKRLRAFGPLLKLRRPCGSLVLKWKIQPGQHVFATEITPGQETSRYSRGSQILVNQKFRIYAQIQKLLISSGHLSVLSISIHKIHDIQKSEHFIEQILTLLNAYTISLPVIRIYFRSWSVVQFDLYIQL